MKNLKFQYILMICILSLSTGLKAQLSGTYTVDPSKSASSSNYKNLQSALTDLSKGTRSDGGTPNGKGVSGAVKIEIADGRYDGPFRLGEVKGTSATNTLTITSASGDSSKVVITSLISSTKNTYTFLVDSTDHVIFDRITLERTGNVNPSDIHGIVVMLKNQADSIMFENCRLIGIYGGDLNKTTCLIFNDCTGGLNNNYQTVKNCYLLNGGNQIYFYGSSDSKHGNNVSILNNIFDSTSYSGLYSTYYDNVKALGNKILNTKVNFTSAINLSNCDSNFIISKNTIQADRGYYLIACYKSIQNPVGRSSIDNNLISGSSSTLFGIYFHECSNTDIFFNTVCLKKGSNPFYGNTYVKKTYRNLIYNNNFTNLDTGVALNIEADPSYKMFDSINYNNLYTSGKNLAIYGKTFYKNLTSWITTGFDKNSLNLKTRFLSQSNLHTFYPFINGKANAFKSFSTDIDGEIRNTTSPDIGADEFDILKDDISIDELLNFKDGDCGDSNISVDIVLTNTGSNSQSNIPIIMELKSSLSSVILKDTVFSTLAAFARDTFSFRKKISTQSGGQFSFKIYSLLSTDQNLYNDTIMETKTFREMANKPTGLTTFTRWGPGSLKLYVDTAGKSFENLWYNSDSVQAKIVAIGDSFNTPFLKNDSFFYVAKRKKGSGYIGEKDNKFNSNGGYNNDYGFSFYANRPLTWDSTTVYPSASGNVILTVYDKDNKLVTADTIPVKVTKSGTPVRIATKIKILKAPAEYTIYAALKSSPSSLGLYRNSDGSKFTTNGSSYSLSISKSQLIRFIKTTNNMSGYYYYLYNNKISEVNCITQKVKVQAKILSVNKPISGYYVSSTACVGKSVQIKDSSKIATGSKIVKWTYFFSDSTIYTSSVNGSFNKIFKYSGNKKIKLITVSDSGYVDSFSSVIKVYNNPVSAFLFPSQNCQNNKVQFISKAIPNSSSSNTKYLWIFGNTDTSHAQNGIAIFKNSGKFINTFVVENGDGCVDSSKQPLQIDPAPIADYNYFGTCEGETTFLNDNSSISFGKNTEMNWKFGLRNDTGKFISYTLGKAGTYPIKLIIVSDKGCKDSITKSIYINALPVPKVSEITPCENSKTTLIDSSTSKDGRISKSTWFYKSKLDTGRIFIDSFGKAGNYSIKMVTQTDKGCKDSINYSLKIQPTPNARFTESIGKNCLYTFKANDTTHLKYNWEFGDLNTGSGKITYHTYAKHGVYLVELLVEDKFGCMNSDTISGGYSCKPVSILSSSDQLIKSKVFPNPANEFITLELENPNYTNAKIDLINIEGKLIKTIHNGNINLGNIQFKESLNNLTSGLYYFRLSFTDRVERIQFNVLK